MSEELNIDIGGSTISINTTEIIEDINMINSINFSSYIPHLTVGTTTIVAGLATVLCYSEIKSIIKTAFIAGAATVGVGSGAYGLYYLYNNGADVIGEATSLYDNITNT